MDFKPFREYLISWLLSLLSLYSLFCKVVLLPGASSSVVYVRSRKFRLLRLLGEGGYAYVYLAKEETSSEEVAIKKILVPNQEKLHLAIREISSHTSLSHRHILPVLDHDIIGPAGSAIRADAALKLSCANRDACLDPEFDSKSKAWRRSGSPDRAPYELSTICVHLDRTADDGSSGPASVGGAVAYMVFPACRDGSLLAEIEQMQARLSEQKILDVFIQLCDALHYLHDVKGIAHLDVKPHNILISRPAPTAADVETNVAPLHCSGGVAARGSGDAAGGVGSRYHAYLMDFGSASSRHAFPATRQQAIALQEEAAAHCTATYRAPELFDVQTGLPLDYAKCDVWAAGCTLYHAMYGASPFQRAVDQPGGSIALAALNGSISWPRAGERRYSEPMHNLVKACLVLDPALRPTAQQLLERASLLISGSSGSSSCHSTLSVPGVAVPLS